MEKKLEVAALCLLKADIISLDWKLIADFNFWHQKEI